MTYDPYQDQGNNPYGQQWSGPPYVASPAEFIQPAEQYFGTQQLDGGFPAPPPPPKRQNVVLIIVCTVLVTVVAVPLLLCAFGFFGAAVIGASTANSSTSPTPAKPSATSSASPSNAAQLIQPAGAPYSYRIPTAFQTEPVPSSTATAGPSASPDPDPPPTEYYTTAVTTENGSAYDYISVASFTVKQEASAANETALAAQFDKWIKTVGEDPSTRADVAVGSYLSFKYTFAEGARGAYDYFVFNGHTVIDVTCAWSSEQANIQRGCQELLNTLRITA